MKFIIMMTPLYPVKDKEGETVQQYRFHSGIAPITGPIKDDAVDNVIDNLKEKENMTKDVVFLVFDGIIKK